MLSLESMAAALDMTRSAKSSPFAIVDFGLGLSAAPE
jgi:hypothetical protein